METTTNLEPQTLEKIQELIATNIDSCHLFREAAHSVDHAPVESLFENLASTRSGLAEELQSYVRLNREDAEDSGSLKGSAHSLWVKVRAALNGEDAEVVLVEAERAEDRIKEKYEEVLRETAGSPLNRVLTDQYRKVKAGHDRVRDLRDRVQAN